MLTRARAQNNNITSRRPYLMRIIVQLPDSQAYRDPRVRRATGFHFAQIYIIITVPHKQIYRSKIFTHIFNIFFIYEFYKVFLKVMMFRVNENFMLG